MTVDVSHNRDGAPVLGVMDSGVGGLAVLAAMQALAPELSYVFLADTAWMPYGDKPPEELRRRIWQLYQGLRHRHNLSSLVLGCNTASSSFHISPAHEAGGPILDIVAPTVRHVLNRVGRSNTARVAMLATVTTVRSHRYEEYLHFYEAPFQFRAFACPGLASAIEGNWHEPLDTILAKSLEPVLRWQPDWLILGCTHYLHIERLVAQQVGPGIQLINPATSIAGEVLAPLLAQGVTATSPEPKNAYYTTGDLDTFNHALSQLPVWAPIVGQVQSLALI